jgi:hypothetical protein
MQTSPPNSQTVHRMSMLGDLDKDCKTLEAEGKRIVLQTSCPGVRNLCV